MTEKKLDKLSLRGMSVYFEKSCRTDKLRNLAEVLLLHPVHDRMKAVVRALCLTVVPIVVEPTCTPFGREVQTQTSWKAEVQETKSNNI